MHIRQVTQHDKDKLYLYLKTLSEETRKRFGPHPFDEHTAWLVCSGGYKNCMAYICLNDVLVVGYAIVKQGYVPGDRNRYIGYPITLSDRHDYTLAPSVADAYQSRGVGSLLLEFVLEDLRKRGAYKIILWGGVQASNLKAVNFYYKHGFRKVGEFEYYGNNYDMVKYLQKLC
ncbi:GNAT family N-acetyltransferase [Saccharicrinis sp. GN24d3]|uniref:GNAT family N-acetyltransferase n=1 Tax=Saccharicrinis sp. GN24d3 TaxID=3458416 RepID=UPI004036EE16